MEQIKTGLVDFFKDMIGCLKYFKRKTYADSFQTCYMEHQDLLASVIEACEEAEDKEMAFEELASAIPDYVHDVLKEQSTKRKMEALNMDYNLAMVTFVIPVLDYRHHPYLDQITDRMVEKWNSGPVSMKISKSSFEALNSGFRSRLCYITTAICESQDKSDDCYELNLLREYRDRYLRSCDTGEEAVQEYYDIAPTIVNRINRQMNPDEIYKGLYQTYLRPCVRLIENGQDEQCQEVYTEMVRELQKKYLYS